MAITLKEIWETLEQVAEYKNEAETKTSTVFLTKHDNPIGGRYLVKYVEQIVGEEDSIVYSAYYAKLETASAKAQELLNAELITESMREGDPLFWDVPVE